MSLFLPPQHLRPLSLLAVLEHILVAFKSFSPPGSFHPPKSVLEISLHLKFSLLLLLTASSSSTLFSPFLLPCHQRGASSVQLLHPLLPLPPSLLPSHPSVPSRPFTSLPPPSNTPQINTGLISQGGDAEHIARSAGRKEKAVCHCVLALFLSLAPLLFL